MPARLSDLQPESTTPGQWHEAVVATADAAVERACPSVCCDAGRLWRAWSDAVECAHIECAE
eukprot:8234781-Alexandrium_andersonii.AAC.1